MTQNEILISIIIPTYNVEDYLADAIESLLNQTLCFEDNVQLILVDDGSPDNSKKIALEYQENIVLRWGIRRSHSTLL